MHSEYYIKYSNPTSLADLKYPLSFFSIRISDAFSKLILGKLNKSYNDAVLRFILSGIVSLSSH